MNEEYKLKKYIHKMNVDYARTRYRQRYFMLKFCKTNSLNDPADKKDAYRCNFCSSILSQSHLYTCPRYEVLRRFHNLEDEDEAVRYLVEVLRLNHDSYNDKEDDDDPVDG